MISCSVIIPTRDRPQSLAHAVTSAFASIPDDGEVIVVDDASKEPAEQSLSQFAGNALTVIRNTSSLGGGGSPSRNKGAAVARGRVIFFLDDDDEFMPGYCEEILKISTTDQADFGFCARKFALNQPNREPTFSNENRGLPAGVISTRQPFAKRTFPFSAGFWVSRSGLEKTGPMAENLVTNSDTEFCCRMYSRNLRGWFYAEPGVIINSHTEENQGQLAPITKRARSGERAAAFRNIAEQHNSYLSGDAGAAVFVHQRWMKHALRAGDLENAQEAVKLAPQGSVRAKLALQLAGWRVMSLLNAGKSR